MKNAVKIEVKHGKTKKSILLLTLVLLSVVLLVILRFILHQSLADISLFSHYTSPMEKNLTTITQLNETYSHFSSRGKAILCAFVIGSMASISMSYLFIFLLRKKQISALYFSLAGIFLGLRLSFTKETLFMQMLFDLSPEHIVLGDLITGMMALLFFLLFYSLEFINPKYKKLLKILVSVIVVYGLMIVVFPLQLILDTFIVYQAISFITMLYIVVFTIMTVTENKEGSILNVIGFLILFALSWNDILHYSDYFTTNEYIIIGVFIYFSILAIHLAKNLANSFEEVTQLTEETHHLNLSLEKKVEQRTRQLLEANNTLQNSEQARQRLLTNVSHELNTPLAFIQGYTKAMLDDVVPMEDTSYLRAIYEDTVMMSKMIEDLQELSMIELGHVSFQLRYVNVLHFMKQLFEESEPMFKERRIRFTYAEQIDSDVLTPLTHMDPIRVKQVVNNLLVNAEKFTSEEGEVMFEVVLTTKAKQQIALISIVDTGIGIKDNDLPYLFERLYKGKGNVDQQKQGSGLGLSIAQEIIEFHGGDMGVESQYGKGSTFYFSLPLKEDKEEWE